MKLVITLICLFCTVLPMAATAQEAASPAVLQQVEALRTMTETMERIAAMAKDPSASGIAAVVAASEMLKPQGPDKAIDFLNRMLAETRDPGIKRAIRFQLAEHFKNSGRQEQALEQYRLLITGG